VSPPVFAEELRKAREEAGLTQEALAARAGVTREYVSHLERDRQEPSLSVFVRLCEALGVRPPAMLERVLKGQAPPRPSASPSRSTSSGTRPNSSRRSSQSES
jgi:transcriptional regulator with XRE-family HTH domain